MLVGLGVLVGTGVAVEVGVNVEVGVWVAVGVDVEVAVGVSEGFNTALIDLGADTSCPKTTQFFGIATHAIAEIISSSITAAAGISIIHGRPGCCLTGLARRITTGPV